MLELLDVLEEVSSEEDVSVEVGSLSGSVPLGAGRGPPGAGGPPPGGLGGCQPQQRPQDAPTSVSDSQKIGITQLELWSH